MEELAFQIFILQGSLYNEHITNSLFPCELWLEETTTNLREPILRNRHLHFPILFHSIHQGSSQLLFCLSHTVLLSSLQPRKMISKIYYLAVSEDKILDEMVGRDKLRVMFQKIIYQPIPKESKLKWKASVLWHNDERILHLIYKNQLKHGLVAQTVQLDQLPLNLSVYHLKVLFYLVA